MAVIETTSLWATSFWSTAQLNVYIQKIFPNNKYSIKRVGLTVKWFFREQSHLLASHPSIKLLLMYSTTYSCWRVCHHILCILIMIHNSWIQQFCKTVGLVVKIVTAMSWFDPRIRGSISTICMHKSIYVFYQSLNINSTSFALFA